MTILILLLFILPIYAIKEEEEEIRFKRARLGEGLLGIKLCRRLHANRTTHFFSPTTL